MLTPMLNITNCGLSGEFLIESCQGLCQMRNGLKIHNSSNGSKLNVDFKIKYLQKFYFHANSVSSYVQY